MPGTRWHHRWNVLGLTLLSQALVIGIQSYSFGFWIIPWLEDFHAPRSELMLIITLSVFMCGVISPFAGKALDRFPIQKLFCIGATIFAADLLLISLATSHWLVMLLYSVLLSTGVMLCGQLGSQTLITRWFKLNRGSALGISALGISLGAFFMPPIVTTLLPAYGWRETFQLLAAAVFLILVPTAWIVLRHAPEIDGIQSVDGRHQEMADRPQWTTVLLLRNRDFWIISIGFTAMLSAYLPVLYSLGSYAHDLGISQQRAALGASLGAVTLAVGKLTFGKLLDMVEHRRLYWTAAGLVASGIALVSLASSFPLLLAGLLLTSFAIGSYVPMMGGMIVDRFGAPAFGQVMGLVGFVIQLSAVGPFLVGVIRDNSGSYAVAFMVMQLALLPAMIAMWWLSSRK